MSGILGSERFRQDYENFKSKIDRIADPAGKIEAESYLKELVLAIKKMDSMHQEMTYSHTMTTVGNELRETIKSARIKLDRKLKQYEIT
jgi:hypothetical protein